MSTGRGSPRRLSACAAAATLLFAAVAPPAGATCVDCGRGTPVAGWVVAVGFAAVAVGLGSLLWAGRRQLRRRAERAQAVEAALAEAARVDPGLAPDAAREAAVAMFRRAYEGGGVAVRTIRETSLVAAVQAGDAVQVTVRIRALLAPSRAVDEYWTVERHRGEWSPARTEIGKTGRRHLDDPLLKLNPQPSVPSAEPRRSEPIRLEPAAPRQIDRGAFSRVAAELERELRAMGAWREGSAPMPPPRGAFGAPDHSFTQWLQLVLHPRLLAIADGREEPPDQSNVSAIAVRELDGYDGTDDLIGTLLRIDRLIEAPRPER